MDSVRFGRFEMLEKIGEGGMGVVYKARDTRLDRVVAIKMLPEGRAGDIDRRARFVHEARAASALNHPNIVIVHEAGEQDGRAFMVMEFVDGKPLNDLIPRKGMRVTEALRVAAQVADALAAAHAAGIVHRDLKPGNIMVDSQGRVKVLDFGLAKLAASKSAAALAADEETRTAVVLTEEGAIVGSLPYMSPEQAEGRVVDARSDIFSFGAVLYEMMTGQRAFRGESRVATLAAVVEKEPQPLSETGALVPPEVERLIARCLRKDVNRRSQNMTDVKLALEELRDESQSGKLMRPAAGTSAGRRWLWPSICAACLLIAAGAVAWTYLPRRDAAESRVPDIVRLSPDDGHWYAAPSISPDGQFVAYISDRNESRQVWLQQVGGGEPIQLTHSAYPVNEVEFFPSGRQILYVGLDAGSGRSSMEAVSTLGGQPRVLRSGTWMYWATISPDGRQIAFFDHFFQSDDQRLMVMPAEGGPARQISGWTGMRKGGVSGLAWTPDSRRLIASGALRTGSQNPDEWEWFVYPIDGGDPVPMGAGEAMRASGLGPCFPGIVRGNRVLFATQKDGRINMWETSISPGSWKLTGAPRQLTFGTDDGTMTRNMSSTGIAPLQVMKAAADLYLLPLDPSSGQAHGIERRLTHDRRNKHLVREFGEAGKAYFVVEGFRGRKYVKTIDAVDLETAKQTRISDTENSLWMAESPDGRQVAYSVPDGDSYTIRIGEPGGDPGTARVLCKNCGMAWLFSPDGRRLLYAPETQSKPGSNLRKQTVRLLDVDSGKDRPWLEHPTESVAVRAFSGYGAHVAVAAGPPGTPQTKAYLVPWRDEPVPYSEWISVPPMGERWEYAPTGNFFYFSRDSKLMGMRFDPRSHIFGEPFVAKTDWKAEDDWTIRGSGLVIARDEVDASVWLMKLPGR